MARMPGCGPAQGSSRTPSRRRRPRRPRRSSTRSSPRSLADSFGRWRRMAVSAVEGAGVLTRARRLSIGSALLTLVALCLPSGAATAPHTTVFVDPGPGGFTSSNVTYVASIPTGAGVSARVVTVKGQRRLYVSSAHSLVIYDITNPALPKPLGALPIYNWENEDIAVSKDGATTILTEFESALYLHVVDTSNPTVPVLNGSILFDGSHTAECADFHCTYLFASNGKTYDIRDQAHPVALPRKEGWPTQSRAGSAHALHQDLGG